MNDSSGILGVLVGALLVLGVLWFVFGESMGLRQPSTNTTVKVEVPKTK